MEAAVKDGVAHIKVNRWLNHGKEWVAKVSGIDPKYGFKRDFVTPSERNWSRSGKQGDTSFRLTTPGIYQVSDPDVGQYGKAAYKYITFDGQRVREVSKDTFSTLAEKGGAVPTPAAPPTVTVTAAGGGAGAAKKAGNGSSSSG